MQTCRTCTAAYVLCWQVHPPHWEPVTTPEFMAMGRGFQERVLRVVNF